MAIASLRKPALQDVVIHKLDLGTYVLCVDDQPCGQFFQWYRVFGEALERAAAREASVWLRENGTETLLHRPTLRPALEPEYS